MDMDHCAGAGQSNVPGRGDKTKSPLTVDGMALEIRDSGMVPLLDPIGGPQPNIYAANTGSFWPAFANEFTQYSERPFVLTQTAVGGTYLLPASTTGTAHWGPGGSRFATSVAKIKASNAYLIERGHTPHLKIIWALGESDAAFFPNLATLEQTMYNALLDLLARYRIALELPDLQIFIVRLGTRPNYEPGCLAVRNAQDRVCQDSDGFVMIYEKTKDFPALGWMNTDLLHYNQYGLNDIGTQGARAMALSLGLTEFLPIPPSLTHRTNAASLMTI